MSADLYPNQLSTKVIHESLGIKLSAQGESFDLFKSQSDISEVLSGFSQSNQSEQVDGCEIIQFNPKGKSGSSSQPEPIFDTAQSIASDSGDNKQKSGSRDNDKGYGCI